MLRIRHLAIADHSGVVHSASACCDGDISVRGWNGERIGDDTSSRKRISDADRNIKQISDADRNIKQISNADRNIKQISDANCNRRHVPDEDPNWNAGLKFNPKLTEVPEPDRKSSEVTIANCVRLEITKRNYAANAGGQPGCLVISRVADTLGADESDEKRSSNPDSSGLIRRRQRKSSCLNKSEPITNSVVRRVGGAISITKSVCDADFAFNLRNGPQFHSSVRRPAACNDDFFVSNLCNSPDNVRFDCDRLQLR
jgi:hypothetical protein